MWICTYKAELFTEIAIVIYMRKSMNNNEPFDLRLPTPGCYLDPEKAGMDSDDISSVFYTWEISDFSKPS